MLKLFEKVLRKILGKENVVENSNNILKVIAPNGESHYVKKLSYETIRNEIYRRDNEQEIIFEDSLCDDETSQRLRIEGYWVCTMWSETTTGKVLLHIIPKP